MIDVKRTVLAPALLTAMCVGAAGGFAPAQDADDARKTTKSDQDQAFKNPQQAVDERIDTDRITEQDPPPLPSDLYLPMPPTFRLAAKSNQVPISLEHWNKAHAALARGVTWLQSAQHEKGGWLVDGMAAPTDEPDRPAPVSIAVTAMAMKAIAQADPKSIETENFAKAVNYLLDARQESGSFDDGPLSNYVNSAVVMALAGTDEYKYRAEIARTVEVLKNGQWDQTEGLSARQDWFGGAGYGTHGRPDLSNTQMFLDALYEAHLSPDEPAFQRAHAFLSRAQNLKQTNPSKWAGNDGGFVYTPANGGESMASEAAGEGRYGEKSPADQPRSLRSYGSMTYAGFKSMLYAGLSADDIRVRAAFDWVRRNWTFEENPGMGQQGLFYYYQTVARCLAVAQQNTVTDIDGVEHNWREELIDAIVARQNEDGSWTNEADRWMEGIPELATIHALLALEESLKQVLYPD